MEPVVVIKNVEQVEHYQGEHEIPGIRFRPAASALGVTAWGMNAIELDPRCTLYPEHDHVADGQEEVYVVLRGSATLRAGDREWPLRTGDMARVGPSVKRKIVTGDEGVTLLAIGATPGQPYGKKE